MFLEVSMAQQRAAETRARILDAALEGFARYGYDATGVGEICRRAEISKGAFYHHFPSKQAVFLELMEKWLAEIDTQLALIQAETETAPEALMQMASTVGAVFRAAGGQLPMFLEFWSKAARDPGIWRAVSAPYRRYQAFFCDLIEQGIEEGSLRSVDPELAAQVIVSVSVGLVLQGLVDPHSGDWARIVEDSMRLVLGGLERS
jgi:AcrR family transcriptional regulator